MRWLANPYQGQSHIPQKKLELIRLSYSWLKQGFSCSLNGHIGPPPITLTIELRMVLIFWGRSPLLFEHNYFWYLLMRRALPPVGCSERPIQQSCCSSEIGIGCILQPMVRLHVLSSGRIGHTIAELSITNDNAPSCIQSEIGTSVLYIYIPECIEMFGRDPSGYNAEWF